MGVAAVVVVFLLAVFSSSAQAEERGHPTQVVQQFEVDAYVEANDVSPGTAKRHLEVQHQGLGIVEQLEEQLGRAYAGVWFDSASGRFIVPVAAADHEGEIRRYFAAKGLQRAYRIERVGDRWAELEGAQETIDQQLKAEIHTGLIQTSIDVQGNAVVVHEAEGAAPAVENRVAEAADAPAVDVVLQEADNVNRFEAETSACKIFWAESTEANPAHRNCDRPLRGGVGIYSYGSSSGNMCSMGFAARGILLNNPFMLTAGHCVNGFSRWHAEDSERYSYYVGDFEAGQFPGRDYAAIRLKQTAPDGTPNYWLGGPEGFVSRVVFWGGSQNIPIDYEAAAYVGQQVCRSGTRTGSSCGTVIELNRSVAYPQGVVGGLTVATFSPNYGDSGGSVWAGNTALGLFSGFDGQGNTLFQEITEATDAMAVRVGARLSAPPYAITGTAGPVGGRDATLHGTVDPASTATSIRFEYGTTPAYGASTAPVSVGSGSNPTNVSQAVSGLLPATQYHYRLVAENAGGTSYGANQTFTTSTASPLAVTNPVGTRTQTSAILKGAVEPGGLFTSWQFEHGPTASYGAATGPSSIGASSGFKNVEATVTGLLPEHTYYFRTKASNSLGSSVGANRSFTTQARNSTYLSSFDTAGPGATQPLRPMWPAVDAAGNVYVADRLNSRVVKYNAAGEYASHFGSLGSGNGQFKEPRGIAISPVTGNIFVADNGNARIQQFTPSGVFVSSLTMNLVAPYDLVIDEQGIITVTDPGILVQFVPDGSTYKRFTETHVNGQVMKDPGGLALDADGDVWVAETGTDRVVEWEKKMFGNFPDYSATVRFGSSGTGPGQFAQVYDVAVKPSGNLFVLDRNNNRIQQMSPAGEFLGSFGTSGSGAGQLKEPVGIALGQGGVLYVSDTGNNRMQRWMVE
jgi:NHL repeat